MRPTSPWSSRGFDISTTESGIGGGSGRSMQVLVIGSGGREHALAWKIAQSPRVTKVWAAPGNAGISEVAESINISPSDIRPLADFAERKRIDLTVVGPEVALTLGLVDECEQRGLRVFSPRQ